VTSVTAEAPVPSEALLTTPAPAEAVAAEDATNGTLLEFPLREAQLARLRQEYATRG
jgi:hypothetical protein